MKRFIALLFIFAAVDYGVRGIGDGRTSKAGS